MHQESTQNFGWAGPEFIEHVLKISEKSICDKYDEMLRYVMSIAKGKSGSHVAGISAVALADAMIDTWFFDSQDAPEPEADPKKEEGKDDEKQITISQESWDRAKRMAASILPGADRSSIRRRKRKRRAVHHRLGNLQQGILRREGHRNMPRHNE